MTTNVYQLPTSSGYWHLHELTATLEQTVEKEEDLRSLSRKLAARIMWSFPFRMTLLEEDSDDDDEEDDEYLNRFSELQSDFKVEMINLNREIALARNRWSIPCRLLLTIFNRLPIPLEGRVNFTNGQGDTQFQLKYLKEALLAPGMAENEQTAFPFTAYVIDYSSKLTFFPVFWEDETRFCACRTRVRCMVVAMVAAAAFFASPIISLRILYKNRQQWHWRNRCIAVLDIALGVLLTPVLAAAAAVKFASGALLAPKIAVHSFPLND